MNGGLAHVGRVGPTTANRSFTSCRASNKSVPRSKISRIDDSCSTEDERISSRPGIPARLCSRGIVTSDSTSDGGQTEGRRLHLDARRSEFRKDVDLTVGQLLHAEEHESGGKSHHDVPVLQTRTDNPSQHSYWPTSRFRTPRRTTRVLRLLRLGFPQRGPSEKNARRSFSTTAMISCRM